MHINKSDLKQAIRQKAKMLYGKSFESVTPREKYTAFSQVILDHITRNWLETEKHYAENGQKQVYYLSVEFLLGRLLGSNLLNLGIGDICEEILQEMGFDLNKLEEQEADAGLGNGGLGRLAACFLDSLASLQLPGHGCGIRYKYGLFEQKVVDGYQVELPDHWLRDGYAWEVRKPDRAVEVRFGGTVRTAEVDGKSLFIHENYETVMAVAYDIPVVGYQNNTVNTLRLWSAEPVNKELDFASLSRNDYLKAIDYKYAVESISEILYPDDSYHEGRMLRLKQEYFLVSAGIKSIVRHYKQTQGSMQGFETRVAIHINDTHPALAVPELMRILMDETDLSWDEAWRITTNTISYTNHTILPEALEKWPTHMVKGLLPRIHMIIEEINERLCRELWEKYPGDWERIREMAIIADDYVHMANLAIVGGYCVNGVAALHTEILKKQVMRNFYEFSPRKFTNKTNGVTHRRWLLKSNPPLSKLITETIGPSWITHPSQLAELQSHADDPAFQQNLLDVKNYNKRRLAMYIENKYGIKVSEESIFDIHVKRIHAYKRQLLNALHILYLYNQLKEDSSFDMHPRVFIFGGKAAPGYYLAKRTIKLINTLAETVNNDKNINDKLKVVFLENYGVSLAEMVFPAADVSEQISTASKEASGTGNMKFMMNGAVTIGTLDGANIEIREAVGEDNFVAFGLTADQVLDYYKHGGYSAWELYKSDPRIKTILDHLIGGALPIGREGFRNFYDALLHHNDEFFVLKDFASYAEAHTTIDSRFRDRSRWLKMSAYNIARSGVFSSDRTIWDYATDIWNIEPATIE